MADGPLADRIAAFTEAKAALSAAVEKAVALVKALRPAPGSAVPEPYGTLTQEDARAIDGATASMKSEAEALEKAVDAASVGLLPNAPKDDHPAAAARTKA